MVRLFISLVITFAPVATPATAAAQDVEEPPAHVAVLPPPPPPEPAKYWYGWQLIPGDALALGLGIGTGDWQWGFMVPFNGLIIHAANGEKGRAAASLAMRAGLPLLAYAVTGWPSTPDPCSLCVPTEVKFDTTGLVVGAAIAMVLDWTLLAHGTEDNPPPRTSGLFPNLQVAQGRAQVGLGGTF